MPRNLIKPNMFNQFDLYNSRSIILPSQYHVSNAECLITIHATPSYSNGPQKLPTPASFNTALVIKDVEAYEDGGLSGQLISANVIRFAHSMHAQDFTLHRFVQFISYHYSLDISHTLSHIFIGKNPYMFGTQAWACLKLGEPLIITVLMHLLCVLTKYYRVAKVHVRGSACFLVSWEQTRQGCRLLSELIYWLLLVWATLPWLAGIELYLRWCFLGFDTVNSWCNILPNTMSINIKSALCHCDFVHAKSIYLWLWIIWTLI